MSEMMITMKPVLPCVRILSSSNNPVSTELFFHANLLMTSLEERNEKHILINLQIYKF